MLGFFLPFLLGVLLIFIVKRTGDRDPKNRLLKWLLAGYALRLGLQFVTRDIQFFSHAAGGDCMQYEAHANLIARYWDINGPSYVTDADILDLGTTSLPQNVFAVVVWLNGGPTRLGCTAVVALAACLTCLHLHRFAIQLGADPDIAFRIAIVIFFSPAFVFYTCDTFKDGFVAFLIVAALRSCFTLSHRFSVSALFTAGAYLFALWGVRFYLVFLCMLPVAIGLLGTGARSFLRPLASLLGAFLVLFALSRTTTIFETLTTRADTTYQVASSTTSRDYNQIGGSGVTFDDGGQATGKLWQKTLYVLFSPFPWQFGSLGFNVGKLDGGLFAFFIYRAYKSARDLLKRDRALLMMFLSFLVPVVLAYATTMANIGLMARQRLPIVMVTAVLGTLSWPAKGRSQAPYVSPVKLLGARRPRRSVPRIRPRIA